MIKIEKVELGVFPYGSGSGMTMGHIHFLVDNEPVEDVKKSGEELIKRYEELVKAAGLESEEWNLKGSDPAYLDAAAAKGSFEVGNDEVTK